MKIKKRYLAPLGLAIIVAAGFMSCMGRGTMQSITISPTQAIIAKGNSQQFTATAHFSDGTAVDWTSSADWSSGNPELVSVITATGTTGLATALSATTGSVTITTKDAANNLSADATLFITPTPLISLEITPVNLSPSSAYATISVGETQNFVANGTYADGSTNASLNLPELTQFVNWTSSNPEVATIGNVVSTGSNTQESKGVATAVGPGITTITATDPATQVSESTVLIVE